MNYEPEDMNNEEIERAAKLSGSQVRAIGIFLLRKCVPDLISTEIKGELTHGCWQPRGSQMAKTPLEIASLARMHTKKAVKTLAAIMNEPHAPYAARVAAAEALLDRGWGKPRQSHEAEITHRYVIEIPALMDNATWEAEALEHEPDKLQ
jgi:hypothetical protein